MPSSRALAAMRLRASELLAGRQDDRGHAGSTHRRPGRSRWLRPGLTDACRGGRVRPALAPPADHRRRGSGVRALRHRARVRRADFAERRCEPVHGRHRRHRASPADRGRGLPAGPVQHRGDRVRQARRRLPLGSRPTLAAAAHVPRRQRSGLLAGRPHDRVRAPRCRVHDRDRWPASAPGRLFTDPAPSNRDNLCDGGARRAVPPMPSSLLPTVAGSRFSPTTRGATPTATFSRSPTCVGTAQLRPPWSQAITGSTILARTTPDSAGSRCSERMLGSGQIGPLT